MLRSAVERELSIIGEAVNRIGKSDPTVVIEHSRRIIDTRNWVIHSYAKLMKSLFGISSSAICQILKKRWNCY
jgi:uncharacterized protein with HEPN domain